MPLNSFFSLVHLKSGVSHTDLKTASGLILTAMAILALGMVMLPSAQAAKKYTLYQCGSQTNLDKCTETCVQVNRYEPITIEFSAREERGEVVAKKHVMGGIVASTFKGCSIFDEENWNCNEEIDIGDTHLVIKNSLANELYTSIEVSSTKRVTSFCAK